MLRGHMPLFRQTAASTSSTILLSQAQKLLFGALQRGRFCGAAINGFLGGLSGTKTSVSKKHFLTNEMTIVPLNFPRPRDTFLLI